MNRDDKKLVFVSYAHVDKRFLGKELKPFLDHLELREHIELWHDQLIGTGDIVIIPAGVAHGFSEITEAITYMVVRIDPEQLVQLK